MGINQERHTECAYYFGPSKGVKCRTSGWGSNEVGTLRVPLYLIALG